ncbi:GAF domain-containing protein [Parabacteroides distasonis]|uniref:GAF domain-containing protein n=1 Tax=Parabacteroides distasonis TaxID=823 RepID=UPI001D111D54|nr:GAF domain-containing protein [Parabacteroides distasonis]
MALSLCERIYCVNSRKTRFLGGTTVSKRAWISFHDVSKMPEEAKSEQHLLILQEVFLISHPIFKQGKPSGFIGFDSVKKKRNWSALDIENLHMLADILSIAIERGEVQGLVEHTAMQVMKSETKFKIIFDKMPWGAELMMREWSVGRYQPSGSRYFWCYREQAVGLNMFENPNIPKYVNQSLKNGKDIFFLLIMISRLLLKTAITIVIMILKQSICW